VASDIARGPVVVETSALEALCRQNARDRQTRNTCLGIVREVLAPFGLIVLAAGQGTGTVDQPGIGVTLETPTLFVTLLGVDWQPEDVFSSPGSRHLVAEVEFVSRDPDAWVTGVSGFTAVVAQSYAYPATCLDQCLLGGPLAMGRKMKGRVAFQVPEDVQRLDLEYAQAPGVGFDRVLWTVERPEGLPTATEPAIGIDTMVGSYLLYDLATATMLIEGSGLAVGDVVPAAPTSDDSWIVCSQSPAVGMIVPAGMTVDLGVADPSGPCPGA
jgi:hypothetical protein